MGASKEYYLKLSEDYYNNLGNDEKLYLNHLGIRVKQLPKIEDLEDEKLLLYKKEISKNYAKIDQYLFDKRNK